MHADYTMKPFRAVRYAIDNEIYSSWAQLTHRNSNLFSGIMSRKDGSELIESLEARWQKKQRQKKKETTIQRWRN